MSRLRRGDASSGAVLRRGGEMHPALPVALGLRPRTARTVTAHPSRPAGGRAQRKGGSGATVDAAHPSPTSRCPHTVTLPTPHTHTPVAYLTKLNVSTPLAAWTTSRRRCVGNGSLPSLRRCSSRWRFLASTMASPAPPPPFPTVQASAPGKVILAGEHAVVHGTRALATVINLRTSSTLRFNSARPRRRPAPVSPQTAPQGCSPLHPL